MSPWRLGPESLEQGTPRLVRAASGFFWWVLSWRRGQKLGKLSVMDQVWPFGADCHRAAVWLPVARDTGLTSCQERRLDSWLVTAGEGLASQAGQCSGFSVLFVHQSGQGPSHTQPGRPRGVACQSSKLGVKPQRQEVSPQGEGLVGAEHAERTPPCWDTVRVWEGTE